MAEYLKVSRSGYYKWANKLHNIKYYEDRALTESVENIFNESHQTYGAVRISDELKDQGYEIGKYRAGKLMKKSGLIPKAKKKFKRTTDSDHNKPVAENILSQDFRAEAPDRKWVSDITYVWTHEGWVYLAVIIDLFSRKVVGWSVSERITRHLIISALRIAVKKRKPPSGLIFHSDKGSQYCSNDFIKELMKIRAVQSMSGTGNCYDNSVAESFFHTLKVEKLHGLRFLTRSALKSCIFEYIEVFYNRKRRHSYLKSMSPDNFERMTFFNTLAKCA